MKFVNFKYDVKINIELTGEDLYFLYVCSSTHYDGVCRSASQKGGFLFGFINSLQIDVVGLDKIRPANVAFMFGVGKKKTPNKKLLAAKRNFELNGYQLDTLCKCLESAHILAQTGAVLEGRNGTLGQLQFDTRDLFNKCIDESKRMNNF